jgi:hypothetical protein
MPRRAMARCQVAPFRRLTKIVQGPEDELSPQTVRKLITNDLKQMHAAFTGTVPVSEPSVAHMQALDQVDGQTCPNMCRGRPADECTNPKRPNPNYMNVLPRKFWAGRWQK